MKSKVKDLRISIREDNKKINENQTTKANTNTQYSCISCQVYQTKIKKMNDEINDKDIIIAKSNQKIDMLKFDMQTYLEKINNLEQELENQKILNIQLNKISEHEYSSKDKDLNKINNNQNTYKDELERENEDLKLEITNLSNQLGEQKILEEMLKHQIHKFKEYMIENC